MYHMVLTKHIVENCFFDAISKSSKLIIDSVPAKLEA